MNRIINFFTMSFALLFLSSIAVNAGELPPMPAVSVHIIYDELTEITLFSQEDEDYLNQGGSIDSVMSRINGTLTREEAQEYLENFSLRNKIRLISYLENLEQLEFPSDTPISIIEARQQFIDYHGLETKIVIVEAEKENELGIFINPEPRSMRRAQYFQELFNIGFSSADVITDRPSPGANCEYIALVRVFARNAPTFISYEIISTSRHELRIAYRYQEGRVVNAFNNAGRDGFMNW